MDTGMRTYGDELVAVLSAATAVLSDLPARVHRLTGSDLHAVLPLVDQLAAVAAAGRFTITADAVDRGEVAASQAGSTQQWVADRCPSLDARDAGLVAKAVRELAVARSALRARPGWAWQEGRLSVSAGCVVASELRQLTPLLEPGAVDAVAAGLVAMGEVDGAAGVRRVRPAMLARYGLGQRLQEIEDRHRGLTVLSCGHDIGGGITEYRMRLNPEARAVVEAAINVLSANPGLQRPRGRRGTRPPHHRPTPRRRPRPGLPPRGCRPDPGPDRYRPGRDAHRRPPDRRQGHRLVTIGLDDLKHRTRPGVLVGGVDAGTLLGPETVRRLACDGTVIPVVRAADGHILHWGRDQRYFTTAQTTALWLRDRHCTFPGCTAPATWCDAHHLRHWLDGGPTDLTNGTLLCERHHTIVHRDRLTATLTNSANDRHRHRPRQRPPAATPAARRRPGRLGPDTRQLRPRPRPRTLTRRRLIPSPLTRRPVAWRPLARRPRTVARGRDPQTPPRVRATGASWTNRDQCCRHARPSCSA